MINVDAVDNRILSDNTLVFAKVRPDAEIPVKESENAGYDIYANFDEDYMLIKPHQTKLIPTGIAAAVSEDYYLQVQERGSTGSKGMKYSAGVIDSGYRGEIFIAITNTNSVPIIISKLDKTDFLLKHCYIGDCCGYPIATDDEKDLKVDAWFYLAGKNDYDLIGRYNNDPDVVLENVIYYPYKKAIAQLIVHDVPKMDVKELTYKELLSIPSKRGVGALGSSGK